MSLWPHDTEDKDLQQDVLTNVASIQWDFCVKPDPLATGMWGIHSITIRCISTGCLLTLSVIHQSVHLNSKHQPEVGSIAAGGSFGELALLYFAPRAATIQAKNVKAIWCADSMGVHRTNPPGANWSGSGCLRSLGHRPQALQGRICFVSASKWEFFLDWNVKGWA